MQMQGVNLQVRILMKKQKLLLIYGKVHLLPWLRLQEIYLHQQARPGSC